MKLVIDRSRWWRGNGQDGSRLLREDGTMCCLGFLGRACGYRDEQMLGVASPSAAVRGDHEDGPFSPANEGPQKDLWPKGTLGNVQPNGGGAPIPLPKADSPTIMSLMTINDDKAIEEEVREGRVTDLLKDLGVEVTFEGSGRPVIGGVIGETLL